MTTALTIVPIGQFPNLTLQVDAGLPTFESGHTENRRRTPARYVLQPTNAAAENDDGLGPGCVRTVGGAWCDDAVAGSARWRVQPAEIGSGELLLAFWSHLWGMIWPSKTPLSRPRRLDQAADNSASIALVLCWGDEPLPPS